MESIIYISLWILICTLASVTCSEPLSRQRRAWIISSFSIEEEHPGPFPYELGKIDFEGQQQFQFKLHGKGMGEEPKGVLSINTDTGMMMVHKAVDYEEYQNLRLTFEARRDSEVETKLLVDIDILDINDNPPLFKKDMYEISIGEAHTQGSYLLTVLAYDMDKTGSPNSTFHFEITSVSPNPPNAEFLIDSQGTISFKGCLEYEAADKYTLVVEAKDHGKVVSLSSSTTVIIHVEDGNNHLPNITGHTGTGMVMEGETGASPLRFHITDRDMKKMPAWRAKYTIEGDTGAHFQIETDPETNDGILTVVKPLDFEDGAERELSVRVENEEPYFSCEVKNRPVSGLWTVVTTGGNARPGDVPQSSAERFTILVQDTNDPPMFTVSIKDTMVEENTEIGYHVETFLAIDPDSSYASEFVYVKGDDPDDWVTVDPHTGHITTAKILDRESPYVINNIYTVILYVIDNDDPPMTGTGTLRIHVMDQNDNVPQLSVNHLDMCVSEGPTMANITASELDAEPYEGPFLFQLLGDVEGKWSLDPSQGYTVNLVKEPAVYAGPHTLELKISDQQGQFAIHNLYVTVCDCSVTPNCQHSRATVTQMSSGAIGIIFLSFFVLLFFLVLAIFVSCEEEMSIIQIDYSSGGTLLLYNIEKPGTDCKMPDATLVALTDNSQQRSLRNPDQSGGGMQHTQEIKKISGKKMPDATLVALTDNSQQRSLWNPDQSGGGMQHTQDIKKVGGKKVLDHHHSHYKVRDHRDEHLYNLFKGGSMYQGPVVNRSYCITRRDSGYVTEVALSSLLHQRLHSIQAPGEELGDYDPHTYTDEGDSETHSELDSISIPDTLDLRDLQDLDLKFNQLALICKPT